MLPLILPLTSEGAGSRDIPPRCSYIIVEMYILCIFTAGYKFIFIDLVRGRLGPYVNIPFRGHILGVEEEEEVEESVDLLFFPPCLSCVESRSHLRARERTTKKRRRSPLRQA